MNHDSKRKILSRLSRIEGQVRGLAKMVDADRYCIDVVDQIRAVTAGLKKAESELLKDHIEHCVETAIRSGDQTAQRDKVRELVDTLLRTR